MSLSILVRTLSRTAGDQIVIMIIITAGDQIVIMIIIKKLAITATQNQIPPVVWQIEYTASQHYS